MAKHTDLMAWHGGDLDGLYDGLVCDQEGSTVAKGIWFGILTAAAFVIAFNPNWRWARSPSA
jgi:hypothetical protein